MSITRALQAAIADGGISNRFAYSIYAINRLHGAHVVTGVQLVLARRLSESRMEHPHHLLERWWTRFYMHSLLVTHARGLYGVRT